MTTRFTKVDRSNYTPNFRKTAENDQLDIGWDEGLFSDGRFYRVETWAQDQMTSVSVFMPAAEIENMSNRQFVELFEREGFITWRLGVKPSAYALPYTDGEGNSCWTVSVTLGIEDEVLADGAFRVRPYAPRSVAAGDVDEVTSDAELPDDLEEYSESPDDLLGFGYERVEEESTDTSRLVWYVKGVQSNYSQLRTVVSIEFQAGIGDDPFFEGSQWSYAFNGVKLEVFNRRMERIANIGFDDETERPRLVGEARLKLRTLTEVDTFLKLLEHDID
jgi:hypothetical protein